MTPQLVVAAFLLSFIGTMAVRKIALAISMLDIPGHRSLHSRPVPRGGGIGFIFSWLIFFFLGLYWGYFPWSLFMFLLPGAVVVALVGFIDDLRNLPSLLRLVVHTIGAAFAVMALGQLETIHIGTFTLYIGGIGFFAMPIAIVWSINLFNFMDGIDAIASMEAIFVFVFGGLFFFLSGAPAEGWGALLIAGAVGGFLLWNLPPAKIFMGDAGSGFLGFLIAVFSLIGEIKYGISILLWMILYGVFWFDTTVTLIRRILKGEKWYSAHSSHAFQRLHKYGWPHGKVSAAAGVMNLLLSALACMGFFYPAFLPFAFLLALLLLGAVYVLIEARMPMNSSAKGVACTDLSA